MWISRNANSYYILELLQESKRDYNKGGEMVIGEEEIVVVKRID